MNRRAQGSIVANPVLVGAVTTLVVVVAVFLAYNANNGLPFVPTRTLNVQIANGAELVKGNEVRQGGYRVGVVQDMVPTRLPSGRVGALLKLKLDKKVGALPVDTSVRIRPRSALGLKYVELTRGTSSRMLPDGGTLPASQASVSVDIDQVYSTFDRPTRSASRENLEGFGDALTGRGADLNATIQTAPSLFGHLERVMTVLADPSTRLDRFFKELGDAARIIAPVSAVNAHLFTTMANTFDAFSRDPKALQDTISKSPSTLDVGTRSFAVQRPFLRDTAAFSRDLAAATAELPGTLPPLNRALRIGTPVQRRSIQLNTSLQQALDALRELVRAPTTTGALRGLTATVTTLQPQLRYLGPYVTVCNYWNTFWTFTAEHFTAPDPTGTSQRALLNQADNEPDGVTAQGANEFAHGAKGKGTNGGRPQFLHANTFGGTAIRPNGRADCQAGQQGYVYRGNRYAPDQKNYGRSVVDTPTLQEYPDFPVLGSTYQHYDKEGNGHGRNVDHVPPGETFTAEPGGAGMNP